MSGENQSADTEIPWPSFVDILSAVIMMFIFLLLIVIILLTTMTVSTTSGEAEEEREQESTQSAQSAQQSESQEEQQQQETQSTTAEQTSASSEASEAEDIKEKIKELMSLSESQDVIEEIKKMMQENEAAKAEESEQSQTTQQIESLSTALALAENQTFESTAEFNEMTIYFNRNEITLTEEIINKVVETLNKKAADGDTFLIETTIDPKAISKVHTKEQALARALNTRNVLLDNNITSKNIKMKQVAPKEKKESYDWLTIHINKASN